MGIISVMKRVVKQIIGDKRTLALLILAPVFVLYLLNVVINSGVTKPNIDAYNVPDKLVSILKDKAYVKVITDKEKAFDRLDKQKTDAVMEFKDNELTTTIEGSYTSITSVVTRTVSSALSKYMNDMIKTNFHIQPMKTTFDTLHGDINETAFDTMAPMMMGFFIFFFVFVLAGIAFLRERISGTLDRLMVTPIKRIDIVLGYFLGFGIFAVMQTIIIQLFMMYVLNVHVAGNVFLVLLINVILAATSLSLGTLLSVFANNELQLIQFLPVVLVPQVLFSGLLSLREAPIWVTVLSKIFPLTYGADALSGVVTRGEGITSIYLDLLIITGYGVLFIVLNALALKRYRKL